MILKADRRTYIRDHIVMAAIGSLLAMGVLRAMGDPNIWVGPIGACLAIGIRGVYVASEELAVEWHVSDGALKGPGRHLPLTEVAEVRTVFSAVQVIARDGHKFLIKYQADPKAKAAALRALVS